MAVSLRQKLARRKNRVHFVESAGREIPFVAQPEHHFHALPARPAPPGDIGRMSTESEDYIRLELAQFLIEHPIELAIVEFGPRQIVEPRSIEESIRHAPLRKSDLGTLSRPASCGNT